MGDLSQEWSGVEREELALKEEQVSVTSGKKKASVRKETDVVSVTKPKLVRKNHNTGATPSEPALFSRGRRVSRKGSIRGKSNHGSLFDNRVWFLFEGYLHANAL